MESDGAEIMRRRSGRNFYWIPLLSLLPLVALEPEKKRKRRGKKGKIKTHLEDKAGKTPCSHEVYQSILSLVLTVVSIIFAGKFWGGIGTRTSYKTKHNSLAEI